MLRRLLNAVLLVTGGLLLGWALARAALSPRHAYAVGLLLAAGVALNLVGLFRRYLALRPWLRTLAVAVGLVVLVTLAAIRFSAQQTLESMSLTNSPTPAHLREAFRGTPWLAAGLVYVMVSLAALPRCPAPATAPAPTSDTAQDG